MFALDLSKNHIRVLELSKKGKVFFLNGLGEKEYSSKDELPTLLKELVKATKPNQIFSSDVAIAIPEEETFIKVLQLPKKGSDEIKLLLHEEMGKILPYGPDEVYWDWKIAAASQNHLDIIFVAALKTMVDGYIHLIESAGLEPGLVETEPNALLWGIRNPFMPNPISTPTLVIDMGTSKTTIVIFSQGAIRFTSSVKTQLSQTNPPVLAMEWQEWVKKNKENWVITEKSFITLANQLREYIDYYETHLAHQHEKEVGKLGEVIVSGAWANFPELLDILAKKLGLTIKRPEMVIPLHPAYTTALGLALRGIYEETYASI